jgi:hypothetical protein
VSQQIDNESHHHPSMLSVTRRMICALALIPIVPAVAYVAESCCERYLLPPDADEIRWFDLIFSSLMVLSTILIWRAVIVWTLGRKMLTALVSLIPFVQVIYAQPLWDAGCVLKGLLRIGQEQLGIAVWIWVLIWLWWGCEHLLGPGETRPSRLWRMRMNPRIRVVVASIATLPFAGGVFGIALAIIGDLLNIPNPYEPPLTFLTTAVFAIAAWLFVWRKNVRWTGRVTRQTLLSAGLLIGAPAIATVLNEQVHSTVLNSLLMASPPIGWGVWMALTMWLWPFTTSGADAVEASPRCLKCGYLLKGLTRTRCPECGDERTLDELWAANAAET